MFVNREYTLYSPFIISLSPDPGFFSKQKDPLTLQEILLFKLEILMCILFRNSIWSNF